MFAEPESELLNEVSVSARRVSYDQNERLTKEVSFEEFTLAIKQMHPYKVSGPDGLNPAFDQSFLSIMRWEIFECCKGWLQGNYFPADLNNTDIVLIPKK